MFSSIQSLFTSSEQSPTKPEEKATEPQKEPQKEVVTKKKKDKTANETFIFVRPPPAKTNHPLNLQVQLVPPGSKAPGGISATPRQSIDGNDTDDQKYTGGAELTRTPSNRSTASNYSTDRTSSVYSASTSSFSSVSSASTSGRRAIIPLYNLQAHNVLANLVVDAGTDAKITKFLKRGIEVIDLAVMEPVEVWALTGLPPSLQSLGASAAGSQPALFSAYPDSAPGSRVLRNSGFQSAQSSTFANPVGSGLRSSRPSTPDPSADAKSNLLSKPGSGIEGLPSSNNNPGSNFLTATPNGSTSALSVSSAGFGSDALDHAYTKHSHHQRGRTEIREGPGDEALSPRKRNIFGKLFSKSQNQTPNTTPTQSPAGSSMAIANAQIPESAASKSSSHQRGVTETHSTPKAHARTGSSGAAFLSPGASLSSFGASLSNLRSKRAESPNPASEFGLSKKRNSSSKRSSLIINPVAPEVHRALKDTTSEPGTATAAQEDFPQSALPGTAQIGGTPQTAQFLGQQATPTFMFGPVTGSGGKEPSKENQLLPATLGVQPLLSSLLPFPFPSSPSSYPPNLSPLVAKMVRQALQQKHGMDTTASSISSKHSAMSVTETFPVGPNGEEMELTSILSSISGTKGPVMYVWIVKKWLKGDNNSLFGNLTSLSKRGSAVGKDGKKGGVETRVEVRIEWKRGKDKDTAGSKKDKKKKDRRDSMRPSSRQGPASAPPTQDKTESNSRRGSKVFGSTSSLVPSVDESTTGSQAGDKEQKKKNRLSLNRLSFLSTSSANAGNGSTGDLSDEVSKARDYTKTNPDSARAGGKPATVDDGSDSDREDSETPWICTVKVRKLGAGKDVKDKGVRLKAGTLSPTPHHPKVVGLLKVPYPLPDVEVEPEVGVKNREPGLPPAPPQVYPGEAPKLILTAEEIKDIISSTGLWLVVREGFAGIGKVSRKGDGWRIRA